MHSSKIIPLQFPMTISSTKVVHMEPFTNKVVVLSKTGKVILSLDRILFIKADSNYSVLIDINENRYILTKTLKLIEALLPQRRFFRCHQSYLVNIDFISEINRDQELVLQANKVKRKVPLSRRQTANLKKLFHFL